MVRVLHTSAETWGYPASFLTDNGLIFTARQPIRHWPASSNRSCSPSGIKAKHSRPYHPQTCGKVERFHQTLKRFLAAQEDIDDQEAAPTCDRPLRRLLQRCATAPRTRTQDAGIGLWRSGEGRAHRLPSSRSDGRRLRFDKVDKSGSVTLRHRGRLHHIGIGAPIKAGASPCSSTASTSRSSASTGHPLRRLVLDPTQGLPAHCPDQPNAAGLRCLDTSVSDVSRHHNGGGSGIRTHGDSRLTAFQEPRIRPLCHPSERVRLALTAVNRTVGKGMAGLRRPVDPSDGRVIRWLPPPSEAARPSPPLHAVTAQLRAGWLGFVGRPPDTSRGT